MHPNENAYTETFIQAQLRHLPENVYSLYGAWFPFLEPGGKHILTSNPVSRVSRRIRRGLFRTTPNQLMSEGLRKYLRRNRIDVVLANYGPTGVAVMECCAKEGIPLVVHFHGFDAWMHETLETYGAAYKQLFEMASAIIAVSEDMKSQIISLGCPPEKVHWSCCGVDTDFFSPDLTVQRNNEFISVGRFVDKKAPDLTVKAFSEVVRDFPAAKLRMAGAGARFNDCVQLAKRLGLENNVRFLGPLSPEQVKENLGESKIFVQHSIRAESGDAEGSPVSPMEASSMELALVVTRHGGMKETVVDGETGFLIEEGDVQGMADAMKRLLRDPSLCSNMGRKGRERMKKIFDLSTAIDRLDGILRKASGAHLKRPGLE